MKTLIERLKELKLPKVAALPMSEQKRHQLAVYVAGKGEGWREHKKQVQAALKGWIDDALKDPACVALGVLLEEMQKEIAAPEGGGQDEPGSDQAAEEEVLVRPDDPLREDQEGEVAATERRGRARR